MQTNITTTDFSQMSLDELAEGIGREHGEAHALAETATEKALRVGQMLIEAKARLQHGQWLPWLAENVPISQPQVSRYMKLANYSRMNNLSNAASVNEALRIIGGKATSPKAKPKTLGSDEPIIDQLTPKPVTIEGELRRDVNTIDLHKGVDALVNGVAEVNRTIARIRDLDSITDEDHELIGDTIFGLGTDAIALLQGAGINSYLATALVGCIRTIGMAERELLDISNKHWTEPTSDSAATIAQLRAEVESLKRQLAERDEPCEITAEELMIKLRKMVPKSVIDALSSRSSIYHIGLLSIDQGRIKIEQMLDKFTKSQGKEAAKVLIAMLEYQREVFEKVTAEAMPDHLKRLEAELEAERKAVQSERMNLVNEQLVLPSNVMTKTEVKLIRGALHPDKLASLDAEKMSRAFDIFQRVYK